MFNYENTCTQPGVTPCNMYMGIPPVMSNMNCQMWQQPYKECPMYNCNYRTVVPQQMQPLYTLYNKIHKILMQAVRQVMNAIVRANMGQMPQNMSKQEYDKYVNMILVEITKQEDVLTKELMRSSTEEEESRGAMCPMCNSWMKNLVEYALIGELLGTGVLFVG